MELSNRAICINFSDEMDMVCQKILSELDIAIPTITIPEKLEVQDAWNLLRSYIGDEISLIICRGVLALEIREQFPDKAVLEIVRSHLDIMRTLMPFANQNIRFGCLECPIFCKKVREVAELLNIDVVYYEVRSLAEFSSGCTVLQNAGIDMLVGGSWGNLYPEEINVPYISVDYTEASIRECLENVLKLIEDNYQKEAQKDYLLLLMNHSDEGIISVDRTGCVVQMNKVAQKILKLDGAAKGIEIGGIFPEYADSERLYAPYQEKIILQREHERISLIRSPVMAQKVITNVCFFLRTEGQVREEERQMRLYAKTRGFFAKHQFDDIQTVSSLMESVLSRARMYGKMESTVLIVGESGTGKELFAQSIHNASSRKDRPFVSVNCAAFSSSLLETELFGYAEGAFTGAKRTGKAGVFEMAHGGTLFLDEVGEMALEVQSRLLRVIQEKEVMRLGDDKLIPIDVRIIGATNRDLRKEVDEGRFRHDLYYRLNVLEVVIPPLRERKEDIAPTLCNLIQRKNRELGLRVTGVDAETLRSLEDYAWPGNIRELSNIVERMMVITQSGEVQYSDVQTVLPQRPRSTNTVCCDIEDGPDVTMTLEEVERNCIIQRLKFFRNNKSKTAKSLGIGQATLFRKINRYQLFDK